MLDQHLVLRHQERDAEHGDGEDGDQQQAKHQVAVLEQGFLEQRLARHRLVDQEGADEERRPQRQRVDQAGIEPVQPLPLAHEHRDAASADHQVEQPEIVGFPEGLPLVLFLRQAQQDQEQGGRP